MSDETKPVYMNPNHPSPELCFQCGRETERAGVGEDSIYTDDGEHGPFCEDCWDAYALGQTHAAKQLEAQRAKKDNAYLERNRLVKENRALSEKLERVQAVHDLAAEALRGRDELHGYSARGDGKCHTCLGPQDALCHLLYDAEYALSTLVWLVNGASEAGDSAFCIENSEQMDRATMVLEAIEKASKVEE